MPPLQESDLAGESSHEMLEPPLTSPAVATIELSSDDAGFAEVASDFELGTARLAG